MGGNLVPSRRRPQHKGLENDSQFVARAAWLTFSSSSAPAEDGDLILLGIPARGQAAAQLVSVLQQANAPNATPDYVLPGATVGYHLGYGESFQTTPYSADGNGVTYEIVMTCAVETGTGSAATVSGLKST